MARIEIKYTNGEHITIKLFDNKLSEDLLTHFSKDNDNYTIRDSTSNAYKHEYNGVYSDKIKQNWKIILTQISKLKELGVKFPREIPNQFDFSQDTLNYLHRIFTYSLQFGKYGNVSTESGEFPFTSDYTTPHFSDDELTNHKELYKITEPINSAVHAIERYTITTKGADALQTTNKVSRIYFDNNSGNKHNAFEVNWYPLKKNGHSDSNYNFMEYTEPHMVCLNDTISGKSVLVSYRDDDNPTLPDCTGRLITDGSFIIYPNRNLHDVYESDGFTSWLGKHKMNINQAPLEMAIGHVIESSIPLESFCHKSTNIGITDDSIPPWLHSPKITKALSSLKWLK